MQQRYQQLQHYIIHSNSILLLCSAAALKQPCIQHSPCSASALRHLSCELREPRPAVMSANERKDAVFEAIRGGAEEYLVKPVTKKEVQNIWQHVWKRLSAAKLLREQHEVRLQGNWLANIVSKQ
jgi:DNA-binding NarL/FixJ family response regulator